MKTNELINTCQNQWSGLFGINKLFTIHFIFTDCENTETFNIDEYNNYHLDHVKNSYIENLITKRHYQEVLCWWFEGKNNIYIQVDKF